MKKLVPGGVAVLLTLLALALPAPAGSAPRFALKVDRSVLFSGEQLTATGTSRLDCTWVLEWSGERASGEGRRFTATFTAPTVTRVTKVPLRGRCFYVAPEPVGPRAAAPGGASQRIVVAVPPSWTTTVLVTVLPAGSAVNPPSTGEDGGTDGVLPNTGGPDRWPLVAGLGAVLLGWALTRRVARR